MKINRAGIELLKRWEGCRLKAYRDSVGVLTVGFGHTSAAGPPIVKEGMTITQQEAEDILVRDLVKYEAAVSKALKRTPNENQFSAMVSLCYNIGPGAFAGSSVVRQFNGGNTLTAADSFLLWNKAGGVILAGLAKRRADERKLFMTPVNAFNATPPADPPPIPEKPVATPRRSFWAWFKALFS